MQRGIRALFRNQKRPRTGSDLLHLPAIVLLAGTFAPSVQPEIGRQRFRNTTTKQTHFREMSHHVGSRPLWIFGEMRTASRLGIRGESLSVQQVAEARASATVPRRGERRDRPQPRPPSGASVRRYVPSSGSSTARRARRMASFSNGGHGRGAAGDRHGLRCRFTRPSVWERDRSVAGHGRSSHVLAAENPARGKALPSSIQQDEDDLPCHSENAMVCVSEQSAVLARSGGPGATSSTKRHGGPLASGQRAVGNPTSGCRMTPSPLLACRSVPT